MSIKTQAFIQSHTKRVEPIHKKVSLLFWKAAVTGKTAYFKQYAQLEKKLADIYSNKREFKTVAGFRKAVSPKSNPLLSRQIELLYKSYQSKQGDKKTIKMLIDKTSELEQSFNTFRSIYRGKKVTNNDLNEILKNTRDSGEAKDAWEAGKQNGEAVYKKILTIVLLRNKLAKQLGFKNYYSMSMEFQELNEKELFALFDKLEKLTRKPFLQIKEQMDSRLAKEFGIPKDKLRPWHYRDPFFQQATQSSESGLDACFKGKKLEKLTRQFYEGIGMNIDDILEKSDLYERPGKDQHAFCIDIDAPKDVRVLCNLKSNEQWMDTMLHEFGHGVYDKYLDPELPYFLRSPAHTMTTEAIALFGGRMVSDPDFLREIAGISPKKSIKLGKQAQKNLRERMLVFTRWCLVMMHFEHSLYNNPGQNLNKTWWDLVEKYQFLKRPESRNKPDWASKTHIATAPVYYHNYLLGELHASQILFAMKRSLKGKFKIVNNPQMGPFLIDRIFKQGATKPWNERLKEATGEYLNPDYFAKQYVQI